MTIIKPLIKKEIIEQMKQALVHLQYSFARASNIDLSKQLTEQNLEILESFSSRFARFSDIAITKYFRVLSYEKDPAFRGSVIDLLNFAEKFGWIERADQWRRIRELRNVAAHEYEIDDYRKLYAELIQLTPLLLKLQIQE